MFQIVKTLNGWFHRYNSGAKSVNISDFEVTLDEVANTFVIVQRNGSNIPLNKLSVNEIEVIDETDGSVVETFANVIDLKARLMVLGYTAYLGAGNADSITGLIQQGANVTITGSGTLADPYIINSSGGGGGAVSADDVTETATRVFVTPSEKTAITHSNRSILDAITESFTTALKSAYDGAKSNIDALLLTGSRLITSAEITKLSNTSGTNSGDNATNTTSNAYADAKVADSITNGVTTIAPSQNSVFDALALKSDKSDFEDWTSFAGSSTIVGWTTPNVTFLQYTRTGKVLTIRGRITGTSNSTSTTITIPYTLASLGTGQGDFSLLFTNNSISSATAGVLVGTDNSNVVSFFRDGTFSGWTIGNTKSIAFLSTFIIQ
jgi:hypothetical protein